MLTIPFCIYIIYLTLFSSSGDDELDKNIYYSIKESKPYRELIKEWEMKEKESYSIMAYILNSGNYVVVVFGDALGSICYRAYCYELSEEDYIFLSEIKYCSRSDFSDPVLEGDTYTVTSNKTKKSIKFNVRKGGFYREEDLPSVDD